MNVKAKLLQLGTAAVVAIASSSAMAAVFPDFQVQEGSVPGSLANLFTADKITGNYVEVVTFTPTGVGVGTFDVSILWEAGQFVANDGTLPLVTQLNSFGANGYGLYGFLQSSGTFSTTGVSTTFNFAPGGSLSIYIDADSDTTFTNPLTGAGAFGTGSSGDDYLIATGALVSGQGTLDPSLPTCNPGINCGSFGTSTSFALNAAGSAYFVDPSPFFNLTFESGQLNNFTVAGTQTINGSLDVVFGRVPEPGSLALLGSLLVGLGLVPLRRKVS